MCVAELIATKNPKLALDTLDNVLKARRHRQWTPVHEDIGKKFMELCVELQDFRMAKEGLFQYRSVSQLHAPGSLETVVQHLLDMAESQTADAKARTDQSLAEMGDLDSEVNPEKMLMMTMDDARRADQDILYPRLKFLWECYRNVLETLKNNNKLEHAYHGTCKRAFDFCVEYKRTGEFKRLTDMIRKHLHDIVKYQPQIKKEVRLARKAVLFPVRVYPSYQSNRRPAPIFVHARPPHTERKDARARACGTLTCVRRARAPLKRGTTRGSPLPLLPSFPHSVYPLPRPHLTLALISPSPSLLLLVLLPRASSLAPLPLLSPLLLSPPPQHQKRPFAIIVDENTYEIHLQTRFNQLQAATDLGMWVTGFATVEDINEIRVKTRAPKPQLMATYYQRLTQLFQVSGNHLFHAFAFGEFVRVSETHQRNLSDDLKNANATKLLLATLAIPAFQARTSDMEFNLESQRLKNLAALLGFRETPDRESQLRQLLERDILNRVSESTQKLYRILNTFDPLGIVAKAKPILVELEQDDALKDYVKPLRELIVIRLLEQLSKVYHRVKVDKFRATVEDLGMDFPSVEKLLVRAVRARNLSVKLDHQSGSLRFNHEDVGSMDGTKDHLNDLAGRLSRVVDVVEPGRAAAAAERAVAIRAALAKETLASLATDNADALQRKVIIEQQKERAERDQAERDRVAEQQRLLDEELRQEQERIRQEKEKKKREQEKKERILREIKIKETQATMKRLGMAADKTEDMESVNQDELRKKIREKAMNAHKNQMQRMREQQRRLDFLTRAIRENEVPKLQARFEEQKVADAEHFMTQQAEKKVRRRRGMSCVWGNIQGH